MNRCVCRADDKEWVSHYSLGEEGGSCCSKDNARCKCELKNPSGWQVERCVCQADDKKWFGEEEGRCCSKETRSLCGGSCCEFECYSGSCCRPDDKKCRCEAQRGKAWNGYVEKCCNDDDGDCLCEGCEGCYWNGETCVQELPPSWSCYDEHPDDPEYCPCVESGGEWLDGRCIDPNDPQAECLRLPDGSDEQNKCYCESSGDGSHFHSRHFFDGPNEVYDWECCRSDEVWID